MYYPETFVVCNFFFMIIFSYPNTEKHQCKVKVDFSFNSYD
jgi:hypothetical protein